MAFQTPITIYKALGSIECSEYVLPAIQREFVWEHPKIVRLNARRGQGKRVQDRVSRPTGRHRRERMNPQQEEREAIPAGRDGWGGPERERVGRQLCFGPYPPWEDVQARFEALRESL